VSSNDLAKAMPMPGYDVIPMNYAHQCRKESWKNPPDRQTNDSFPGRALPIGRFLMQAVGRNQNLACCLRFEERFAALSLRSATLEERSLRSLEVGGRTFFASDLRPLTSNRRSAGFRIPSERRLASNLTPPTSNFSASCREVSLKDSKYSSKEAGYFIAKCAPSVLRFFS
jgi:hypothetical protein